MWMCACVSRYTRRYILVCGETRGLLDRITIFLGRPKDLYLGLKRISIPWLLVSYYQVSNHNHLHYPQKKTKRKKKKKSFTQIWAVHQLNTDSEWLLVLCAPLSPNTPRNAVKNFRSMAQIDWTSTIRRYHKGKLHGRQQSVALTPWWNRFKSKISIQPFPNCSRELAA